MIAAHDDDEVVVVGTPTAIQLFHECKMGAEGGEIEEEEEEELVTLIGGGGGGGASDVGFYV